MATRGIPTAFRRQARLFSTPPPPTPEQVAELVKARLHGFEYRQKMRQAKRDLKNNKKGVPV